MHVFRIIVIANVSFLANVEIRLPVPYWYQVPLATIANLPMVPIEITECKEWYMYKTEGNSTYFER